jgi:hypothetical protein
MEQRDPKGTGMREDPLPPDSAVQPGWNSWWHVPFHIQGFSAGWALFSGDGPFAAEALRTLFPPTVESFTDRTRPPTLLPTTVVMGKWGFATAAISDLMDRVAAQNAMPPRFIPQEGFLDEYLFGHDWWNDFPEVLNAALSWHPGIAFAHSLHLASDVFEWPSVDAPEGAGLNEREDEFANETDLHRLGYQITGMTRSRRWEVLSRTAVPRLGLQEVAETIAMLVRTRKAQAGGRDRYRNAIEEWEHDLSRLKEEYWTREAYRFPWPSTEPG